MPPYTYQPNTKAEVYICIADNNATSDLHESLKSPLHSSTKSLLDFLRSSSGQTTTPTRKPLHNIGEKKSVRFADDLEHIASTLSRGDLSSEETENYWFTGIEFWEIQSEKDKIVQMINFGLKREKGTTHRGLEVHTCAGIFRNKINQRHVEAVLGTQMEQRKLSSFCCAELLASSCKETSKESFLLARQYGLKDQKDALRILNRASA